MTRRAKRHRPRRTAVPTDDAAADLRERILADFATLRVPLTAEQLDAVLARAERDGLSHLEFLHRLLAEQADQRRERSIARRIHEARFRERKPLARLRLGVQRPGHRPRRRSRNWPPATSSAARTTWSWSARAAWAKAASIQSIGPGCLCARLHASATRPAPSLLEDLTASLADQTFHKRVRYYARFDLLIIDEFGFDRIERDGVAAGRQPAGTRSSTPAASSVRRRW